MSDLVCPRCGMGAAENEYCSTCGLHLAEQPELPTREQWEARQAKPGAAPGDTTSGTGGDPGSGTPQGPRDSGADGELSERVGARWRELSGAVRVRWSALSATAKRVILAASAAVIAVILLVVVLTSGGGSSPVSETEIGNHSTLLSDAQTCAGRWNSAASQIQRRMAAVGARGRAAADFQVSNPGLCLITIAIGDSDHSFVRQFVESAGLFIRGWSGTAAHLPGNWVWNATVDSNGTITVIG